ncbi:hypothetical protein J6590_015592 [Homalodisca vitripennis]|nr:hypothetical protein J6590_015592 [Homalodisca vitripennis]
MDSWAAMTEMWVRASEENITTLHCYKLYPFRWEGPAPNQFLSPAVPQLQYLAPGYLHFHKRLNNPGCLVILQLSHLILTANQTNTSSPNLHYLLQSGSLKSKRCVEFRFELLRSRRRLFFGYPLDEHDFRFQESSLHQHQISDAAPNEMKKLKAAIFCPLITSSLVTDLRIIDASSTDKMMHYFSLSYNPLHCFCSERISACFYNVVAVRAMVILTRMFGDSFLIAVPHSLYRYRMEFQTRE